MNSKRIHPTLWGVSNVLGNSIGSCQQAPKLQQLHYLLLCCMNLHHCFYNNSLVCPRVDISLLRSGQFSLHLSSNTACKKATFAQPPAQTKTSCHLWGCASCHMSIPCEKRSLSGLFSLSLSPPLSFSLQLDPRYWNCNIFLPKLTFAPFLFSSLSQVPWGYSPKAVYSSRVNTIRAGTFLPFPTHTGKGNKQSHYIVHVNFVLSVHVKSFFLIWSRPAT